MQPLEDKTKELVALGREHYDKREYEKAERFLVKALPEADGYADVHNMLGVIEHDKGRIDAAREHFERAQALNGAYTEALLNLAVTYNDLGRYEDAQQVYRQALRKGARRAPSIDPFARGKIANMHGALAQAYLDLDLTAEAARELRQGLSLCPDFSDLRLRLANVLRQCDELDEAKHELQQAVLARPSYVPARNALGVVLLQLGERHAAVAQWEAVVELEPDDKAAQLYLRMARNPPAASDPPGA